MANVTPLGGANEIGASCFLVEAGDLGVVVDAGIRPKVRGSAAFPNFDFIRQSGVRLDAILLTHAHSDHTGGLPVLYREHPGIPVFATPPTIRITKTLLEDAHSIQERDDSLTPDYTASELQALSRAFVPVRFNKPILIAHSDEARITATFVRAGHIMGAAMIVLDVYELRTGETTCLLFSGDISLFDQPTIKGCDVEAVRQLRPDLFFLEGTYGANERGGGVLFEEARFVQSVARVIERGGRVVIPAFAVGRAQNIATILRRARLDPRPYREVLGDPYFRMPDAPIYVDGMCRAVADTYDAFKLMLHPDLLRERRADKHVFFDSDEIVQPVKSREQRYQLALSDDPWIVISSSGMVTGGAVVEYIKAIASDEKSACFMTGYLDEESPGAIMMRMQRQADGSPGSLMLDGEKVTLHCEISQYRLGAHSDANDIEALCDAVEPAAVRFVHGDPENLNAISERLQRFLSSKNLQCDVDVAHCNETLEVRGRKRTRAQRGRSWSYPSTSGAWDALGLIGRRNARYADPRGDALSLTGALQYGWEMGFHPSEIARLQLLTPIRDPISLTDDAAVQEELEATAGSHWIGRRMNGRHYVYRPARLRNDTSLHQAHESVVRKRIAERQVSDMALDWERVRSEGVREGDLVAYHAGGRGHVALGVIIGFTSWGARILSSYGEEIEIAIKDVLAQACPWPSIVRDGGAHMLHRMQKLLDDYAQEYAVREISQHDGQVDESRILSRIWGDVSDGKLSVQTAAVASVILSTPGVTTEGVSFDVLAERLGQSVTGFAPETLDVIEQLQELGYVQVVQDESAEEVEYRLYWGRARTSDSAERAMDKALGLKLAQIIRDAYHRALEVRRSRANQGQGRATRRRRPARRMEREHILKIDRSVA